MRLYRINALLLKYWYVTINSMDRMFDIIYWPVIGLVVFGFTALYIKSAADIPSIFAFLIGGTILWSLFTRIQQDIGVYILEDFWSRNIANTFATPVTDSEIFLSVTIFGIIRSVISFLVMATIAAVFYHFNLFTGGLAALAFIIPLFLFAWGIGLMTSGIIFRYGTRMQTFTWSVGYLIEPFSAVYYPLTTLPVIMQKIAHALPTMYVFEGFRLGFNGVFSWHHFSWAMGLSLCYLLASYFIFVSSIRWARKTGFLTKY